jgi:8-oxo-dGTP pyrophosphatase MutT (NUDIX family)
MQPPEWNSSNSRSLQDHRLLELRRRLARHRAFTVPLELDCPRASVALIVRPEQAGLELLLIRRARRAGDPWSGHMALPGGRRDPDDPDPLTTAIRESREEVGVHLDPASALGRLDDVSPISGAPRIAVSAWVFGTSPGTVTRLNHEAELAIWVPIPELLHPGIRTEHLHALADGETLRLPAFGYRDHVIWGLTHRILSQFLEIARTTAGLGDAT